MLKQVNGASRVVGRNDDDVVRKGGSSERTREGHFSHLNHIPLQTFNNLLGKTMADKNTPPMAAVSKKPQQAFDETQLWGFDPVKLLQTLAFPGDDLDWKMRRDKRVRREIVVQGRAWMRGSDEEITPKGRAVEPIGKGPTNRLQQHNRLRQRSFRGPNTLQATPGKLLPQQQVQMGAAYSSSSPEALERLHLIRSAAAVTLQAIVRGWETRKKYLIVKEGDLSQQSRRASIAGMPLGKGERPKAIYGSWDMTVRVSL